MAIENSYNPNPSTVDSLLRQRQTRVDLVRESGEVSNEPVERQQTQENPRFFGVEVTPDYEKKPFVRKVGEDAAMLAYAVPVGLAKLATGFVTHPIDTAKEVGGALVQSVKDVVDPEYYKAHPLLGLVNLAGFVTPIAGVAKNVALKTAMRTALETGIKQSVSLGVEESIASTALRTGVREAGGLLVKKGAIGNAVWQAAKTGKIEIVSEVARNLLSKVGVADDVALRVGSEISNNLYTTLSRQTTKMKTLEALAHPVGSGFRTISGKVEPIRKAVFGSPAETAVSKLYGVDVVKRDPQGFVDIERWASDQVKERGFSDTIQNRERMMMEWVDQNSEWAALTPEQRVEHFRNYAKTDLTRRELHKATGIDIVTVKALPQSYVDSMVATLKEATEMTVPELTKILDDNFGRDYSIHAAELGKATTKEALIERVMKLGDKRSAISFAKFSPDVQSLATQLEKTGYRIGHAPKNKQVSYAADIFTRIEKDAVNVGEEGAVAVAKEADDITIKQALATRTAFGRWIDRMGLSPNGVVEGAVEFSYRENFTQRALEAFPDNLKVGKLTIPVNKLFEWIDKNKSLMQQSRQKLTLPLRTIFDVKADDLIRAGFVPEIAAKIESISKSALREVPSSITGMGDAVINYIRTFDKGFGGWVSKWYDNYLKAAYKGRYDWSPFFSAQQFVETKLQSAMFLRDTRLIPGGNAITKLGDWTAEKLAKKLETTTPYLKKIIAEPPLEEVAAVREEILGTLQKTMLDYTSTPDIINIQNAAKGSYTLLKDKAAFEQSIKSRNFWYAVTGQSSVRMATNFNKALAEKFGMNLTDALSFTMDGGTKRYYNPQIVEMMRDATQAVFHYSPGVMTSPLMKTLNIIWFPMRFQAKTVQLAAKWLNDLSPASRLVAMNNWVHFANWAGTDEGIEWRRTNRNVLYNLFAYTTAYEQLGQSADAVTKGRLFGGNAGLIGGVPFGFLVNLARELAILPEDPDQFDPKTGRRFTKEVPREAVSAASLAVAIEQLLISVSPSTPFYSLTGGVISGVSPRKWIESLVRQSVGSVREAVEGRDPARGKQRLERDFKRVPLEYTRLSQ